MNTLTEQYFAQSAIGSCCLTIKTGRNDCYAMFNPALFQLTLVEGQRSEKIDLGFSGSRLLERLLQVPGEVVSRDDLMSYAWADRVVGQGSLNQQIYTLRQVLGDEKNREIIQTLPRRGYQINPNYLSASANDSDSTAPQEPAQPAPSVAPAKSSLLSFTMAAAACVVAIGVGLFAYLYNSSQPAATHSTQVMLNQLNIRYIEQSPQRLEQLIAATQELSNRLAAISERPAAVTLSHNQGFFQVVCHAGQGKAKMLMFNANQLELLRDAQLHRCLS